MKNPNNATSDGSTSHQRQVLLLVTVQVTGFIALAIAAAGRWRGKAGAELMTVISGRLGNNINNAAAGAHALNGIGTADHFNAFYHRRINGFAIARAVTQRVRLWHTVNHI